MAIKPLGQGSNVVIAERIDGLVVQVALPGREIDGCQVTAGAGENWHALVSFCLDHHLYGIENLALIPGTVGAAPIQNIGAYGVELDPFVSEVSALNRHTGERVSFGPDECGFGYRCSRFQSEPDWLVTELKLNLSATDAAVTAYPDLKRRLDESGCEVNAGNVFDMVCRIRREKLPDPATTPNVGSFFKNPIVDSPAADALAMKFNGLPVFDVEGQESVKKLSAAWLIDQAGLKGESSGGHRVSDQHALVIVNQGAGNYRELMQLVERVQAVVRERYEIELVPEPVFLA